MKKLILLALLLPTVALAEPFPYLEKANPNELGWSAYASKSCPLTSDELADVVKGVLIRSRIKPVPATEELSIRLILSCYLIVPTDSYAYSVEVDFGRKIQIEDWLVPILFMRTSHGLIGVGLKDNIIPMAKEAVEHQITKYLKANFDLAEDK